MHEHWYINNVWNPGTSWEPMCSCGAWRDLVNALEAIGIPAKHMNLDSFLRSAADIKRKLEQESYNGLQDGT